MNRTPCPEYRRLLKAYDAAFAVWAEREKVEKTIRFGKPLDALEKQYRALTNHQKSCASCSAELRQSQQNNKIG